MNKTLSAIVIVTAVAIGGMYTILNITHSGLLTNDSASSDIAVGKPCSYNGAKGTMDTKGLQCYFYGEEIEPQR